MSGDVEGKHAIFFLEDFIYLFLERGEGREKARERNTDMRSAAPTRDLAHNSGMCPDLESNQQPFGLWENTQTTELHQSGQRGISFSL